ECGLPVVAPPVSWTGSGSFMGCDIEIRSGLAVSPFPARPDRIALQASLAEAKKNRGQDATVHDSRGAVRCPTGGGEQSPAQSPPVLCCASTTAQHGAQPRLNLRSRRRPLRIIAAGDGC
ncbi:hypothetical protein, partial [Streptomyces sp. PH10-H1]|uniref:hypothetical protein n=1 Tax=Streptomyces sp. PH10-H1 TaxID=3046212 RepID=UPI0024BB1A6B